MIHNSNKKINGLEISMAPLVGDEEFASLEDYTQRVVLQLNRDAEGILLYLIPILLKIDIVIVNVNDDY